MQSVATEPLSREQALAFAGRLLEDTGHSCPTLDEEKLEHGWRLSAGEDVGGVRVTLDLAAPHRVHLEILKMWWPAPESPWSELWDWVRGQPAERPGGHLLWTTVLKTFTLPEAELALEHAREMRQAMLEKARRNGLQPTACRLFHYFGNRLSGEGDSVDGVRWWAEVRHGKIRRFGDSAPLWTRSLRRLRGTPTVS
jgi:hypothetical protein